MKRINLIFLTIVFFVGACGLHVRKKNKDEEKENHSPDKASTEDEGDDETSNPMPENNKLDYGLFAQFLPEEGTVNTMTGTCNNTEGTPITLKLFSDLKFALSAKNDRGMRLEQGMIDITKDAMVFVKNNNPRGFEGFLEPSIMDCSVGRIQSEEFLECVVTKNSEIGFFENCFNVNLKIQ